MKTLFNLNFPLIPGRDSLLFGTKKQPISQTFSLAKSRWAWLRLFWPFWNFSRLIGQEYKQLKTERMYFTGTAWLLQRMPSLLPGFLQPLKNVSSVLTIKLISLSAVQTAFQIGFTLFLCLIFNSSLVCSPKISNLLSLHNRHQSSPLPPPPPPRPPHPQ